MTDISDSYFDFATALNDAMCRAKYGNQEKVANLDEIINLPIDTIKVLMGTTINKEGIYSFTLIGKDDIKLKIENKLNNIK